MSGGLAGAYENGKDYKGYEVKAYSGIVSITETSKFRCSPYIYDEPEDGEGFYKTKKIAKKALVNAIKEKILDLEDEIKFYKKQLRRAKK